MVEALIAGERDPQQLAELSKSTMRAKKDRLVEALQGRFGSHHAVVALQILAHISFLDASIALLSAEIVERPFEPAIALLCGIPGWGRPTGRSSSPKPAVTWRCFRPSGWRRGRGWHPAAMSRRANVVRSLRSAATDGWDVHSSRQPEARGGLATPTSALTIAVLLLVAGPTGLRRGGPQHGGLGLAHALLRGDLPRARCRLLPRRHDPQRQARRLTHQLQQLGYTVMLTSCLRRGHSFGLRPDRWRGPVGRVAPAFHPSGDCEVADHPPRGPGASPASRLLEGCDDGRP